MGQVFRHIQSFVNAFEILVSVLLGVLLTSLSHSVELLVSSHTLSMSVLLVFAFLKVFVESRIVRPWIEGLGWRLYELGYRRLRDRSLEALGRSERPVQDLGPAALTEGVA